MDAATRMRRQGPCPEDIFRISNQRRTGLQMSLFQSKFRAPLLTLRSVAESGTEMSEAVRGGKTIGVVAAAAMVCTYGSWISSIESTE